MARAPRPPRVHACNVLAERDASVRIWSFTGTDARPAGSVEVSPDRALPAKVVGKGWGQLLRPRLNIAWTGEQPVFLQLVVLPTDDLAEVPAMLEHQIEKLSPYPVGQVVWSYEVLPGKSNAGLSVLVLVAERGVVDATLSGLEARGFYADRVECPLVPRVLGTELPEDGAVLFPFRQGTRLACLVGWVVGGAYRSLTLVNLAEDDRWLKLLVSELHRLAWAGEMEGWLPSSYSVRLVGEAGIVDAWREPLQRELGLSVAAQVCPPDAELASASARRAAAGSTTGNLLPAEQTARYRQEFTDRLWMGGLGALFGAYLVAVLIYLCAVEVLKYRHADVVGQFAQVNSAYTNTLRLKAQTQVLQEMMDLRYAALDCWLATIEELPEELTLESLSFSGGQSLSISGVAPSDQEGLITRYWQALQRKVVGNTNLFSNVQLKPTSAQNIQGVPMIRWSFNCAIRRSDF